MAVQEQTPIIEYIANGSTNIFPITFDIHSTEDLGVLINGELALEASYQVQDNSVVFMVIPPSGSAVTLFRDTEKNRLTDYKSYDNSFRPSAINWDLDKLWHVLQEQNLVDAKILARLKTEIEWRRTHDFNYDELAQIREKQIFDSLLGYTNTLFTSTTPNVFEGVTAGVVFALDKKSVQTHLNEIAANLEEIRLNLQNTEENSIQAIASEESRAIGAEENLNSKITNEASRAQAAEDSLLIKLNAVGVGNKAYKTYAEMNADKANIPAKSKVTVTNDTTASNNGDWQWDGVAFTKSAYDPLTQAKAYADANPLFKPATLTAANNLNDVRAEGLYKPTVDVPSLALNYPVTGLGELQVRNIAGNVCVQTYWVYGSFGQWIRTSDGSGNWPATWDQIGTKSIIDTWITASKAPINLTGSNNTDLNTLTNNGLYAVYSTNPVNVSNFPKPSVQGFLLVYTLTNVTNHMFLVRGTNEIFIRSLWGSNGWIAWEKLATSNDLTSAINTAIAALPFAKYDNLIYTQSLDELLRNPLKSSRIKLIGDSITWGMGSSAVSPTEPRTGYLTDPRNSTVFTSKTWANLLRQWIAKVYGNAAITEDRPGSAYTIKTLMTQWREIYKSVKMTSNASVVLTDAQKLAIIDVNVSFDTGTCINLLSTTFPTALRPQIIEFDVTGDNLSVMYQKQSVGDVNDIIEIYVDNVLVDSFNYYAAASDYTAEKAISFAYGKHTIKLVNKATHASSYCRIAGFKTSKKTWVINEGIIGLSTATLLSRNILESTLDGYDDVILFMLGTNDRAESGGTEGFKKRLNDALDKITTLSPNSKVILMSSTYASTDAPSSPYKFDMGVVDKIISTVSRERSLIFISQYKGCAQALIDSEAIWSDGLHLNDRGNQLYYQNIRKKLFEF